MKQGLIIAGGQLDASTDAAVKHLEKGDVAIGVDRGIAFFLNAGIQADYYLGDLDSISPDLINFIPRERLLRFSPEKNASDLELALDLCLEKGLERVDVYGATGSRWDHSLSNLLALERYRQAGLKVVLRNRKNQAWALAADDEISSQTVSEFDFLSILPLSPQGIVVSISGVKYPLKREHLVFGKTRGVSNEGIGEKVFIQLHQGRALFIMSND